MCGLRCVEKKPDQVIGGPYAKSMFFEHFERFQFRIYNVHSSGPISFLLRWAWKINKPERFV